MHGPNSPSPQKTMQVLDVYFDCDRDSLVYLSEPIGPACHTNAPTCYFSQAAVSRDAEGGGGVLRVAGGHESREHAPLTTLFALERTIAARRSAAEHGAAPGAKPSWTARLIADPALCCKKVGWGAGEGTATAQRGAALPPAAVSPRT